MRDLKRRDFMKGAALAVPSAATLLLPRKGQAAASKQRIKIGQISTGHPHASGKLRTILTLKEDYDLVGVVEPHAERREKLRRKFPDVKFLTEEQLLNTKGLQAVAVESDVRDLVPIAGRCVAAGMHLHLDKPPGESFSAYKMVSDEAARKKLTIQMGYIYRYGPAFLLCFHAVREGWLGDIFGVHAVMSKMIGDAPRKGLAEYRGGTMFDIGCHVIDALIKVLGEPDQITAYVRRTRPDKDTLADNQVAVFEYPEAMATIRAAVIEVEGHQRRQFVVSGNQGTIDIRPLNESRLRLALDRPRGDYKAGYQDVELPRPNRSGGGYIDDFLDFAAIVSGQKETDYPPSHDLAVHKATLLASGLPLE
jgi:predicted dehydrogenase